MTAIEKMEYILGESVGEAKKRNSPQDIIDGLLLLWDKCHRLALEEKSHKAEAPNADSELVGELEEHLHKINAEGEALRSCDIEEILGCAPIPEDVLNADIDHLKKTIAEHKGAK